jgi:hypothetical protein
MLNLVADLQVHIMLVLQTCRMQELQSHRGFYPDFKGRLRGQARSESLQAA